MNDLKVKVSVITPVYNAEEHIGRCLDSLLSQSLKGIEIIVIDDGSTDQSWEVISEYAKKHRQIIAIHSSNRGVSHARNIGLNKAVGEFVGFVDSDDYVDGAYFERLYTAAKKEKSDIVSAYVDTADKGRREFYNHKNKQNVSRNKLNLIGVVWLNLYRTSMIRRNDILFSPGLITGEDNLFNLKASYCANKIISTNDDTVMYHYMTREESLTAHRQDNDKLLSLSHAISETVETINNLKNYDKDVYIARVFDVVNYFYESFKNANGVQDKLRHEISESLIDVWKKVKYRRELLQLMRQKGVDLERVTGRRMYSWLDKKLASQTFSKNGAKKFAKKALKAVLPHGLIVLYKNRNQVSKKDISKVDNNKIAVVAAYKTTKYIQLLNACIQSAGFKVTHYPSDARYVWLHWYENDINSYSDFIQKLHAIKIWKDQGKKIILHIHNKKPHDSSLSNLSHALMTSLADSADHVSIMSAQTKDVLKDIWYYGDDFSRVSMVPHPNYIDVYGKRIHPKSLKKDKLKILFFGLVRPYKGVENLLKATEGLDNLEISIFGQPKDDQYVANIRNLCKHRNNVKFRLEHIPDEDIPQIFASHHIVALPYGIESSLNSGAAILALSYGRTVIGTNNGTLKELGDDSMYFGYDYNDEQDHVRQLKKTIQSIQAKYGDNYNELLEVGERALELIKRNNSTQAVSESIRNMINRIG